MGEVGAARGGVAEPTIDADDRAYATSFEAFFEAERRRLFRAMYAITGSVAEAEELTQDAFLKVWERWDRVSALERPVGYLYRVALNASSSRYRRMLTAAKHVVISTAQTEDPYRAVVERLAGGAVMPEPAFDRLVRRRERRRRSRQIVAGSLALVVAAAATVAVARAFHAVQPPRPAGPSITAKNVSRLELAWSAEGPTSTPVISEGRVFATSSDRVFAYPLDCASEGESCDPSWTGDIGPAHTGIQSALAVSDGVVYVT